MSTPLTRLAFLRIADHAPDLAASTYDGGAPDRVQGTGASVIELLDSGPFSNPRNTGNYRVLTVNVLSDRTRDSDGLPVKDDADTNAWALYERVNRLFHCLDNEWQEVFYSARSDGPSLVWIPDGDESVMLSVRYEVCL